MGADEGNVKNEKLDGVLKTFLEELRTRAMLGGEQGDAQRLSEAIAVAGKLTELAGVKPSSDVSSRPMPRDSGNSGGDREKAKSSVKKKGRKEKLKCYFCDGPHLIRGCPEKRRLTAIMKRMGEGEGVNTTKQGSRRGKAVDVEAAKPREKLDTIASVQAINSGERLGEAICSKVAESRGKHGDKVVKSRVQSEQVRLQYVRMEAWSKLRRLRHKGTLKEYLSRFRKLMLKVSSLTEEYGFFDFMFGFKPWAKRVLERMEVKELSKALTTAESIKEFGVKKNKTSKEKLRVAARDSVMKASQRIRNVVPRVAEKIHSMMNQMVSLGKILKMPEVLQNYPRGAKSSKVMDEPKIELSREEDEPMIEEALIVGSIRFISSKESRSQVQEELSVSKEFAEHVCVENMASETILREGLKQGFAEDVQVRNNPSKTSGQESKGAKTLRDKATTEKLPNNKWVYRTVTTDKLKLCSASVGMLQ
ncbi:hypothetical protein F3Y22_tig00110419pilonHSYRG00136 [Hibiscus syriacus]|uniref:Retrotransposon gag domain-containing protein n=1 Tax=Hibiscus syriacus TaxID=106335 RepID=A0A6A3ANT5_HIBSY|nr:hypothetical protein F3Y22_tig00110419pilonHSYRG00136 [Hibiscus syriacus]